MLRAPLWLWALAGAIAASVGVWSWFQRDLGVARSRLNGQSEVLEGPFGRIEYAVAGAGAPVLVLHGSAGGYDQGLEMVGPLAERGYRLIAPSRAGYLQSTLPSDFSVDNQADQYVSLLDQLGIGKVTVLAISAGAWSALAFAERHPDRCQALVLLVPADRLPEGTAIHGGWISETILRSDFAAWLAIKATAVIPGGLTRVMLGSPPAVLAAASSAEKDRIAVLLKHLLPLSSRWPGVRFDVATAAHPPIGSLDDLQCPVLAISAADDAFDTAARARQIVSAVRGAELVVYASGGHALIGRTGEALDAVDTFLRSHL
jgi:2-hydroxy-6-oxonona-2,4-dienedioate hydrolase